MFQYVMKKLNEQSKHTTARTRDQNAFIRLIGLGGNQCTVCTN